MMYIRYLDSVMALSTDDGFHSIYPGSGSNSGCVRDQDHPVIGECIAFFVTGKYRSI